MGKTDEMLFCRCGASYCWIKKRQEKPIATNSGKMRVNINGVINIDSDQMAADFTDKVNSDSMIRLLEKIDKMYPSAGKIHVVLDSVTYDHSGLVLDWLSLQSGLSCMIYRKRVRILI